MKWITPILSLVFWAAAATAQPGTNALGGYSEMSIDPAPHFSAVLGDGFVQIEEMSGGVRIVLRSEDPSLEDLPIRAYTIRFAYAAGSEMPSVITLEGNVRVQHPQASVTAEKAVWNFETGALVFTGNPVMDSDTVKGLSGSRIVLNFKENTLEVKDLVADEVPFGGTGTGGAPDPSLLAEGDVRNWPGFIGRIKSEMKAEGDNPGKQLAAKLNPELRGYLEKLEASVLAQQQERLLEEINGVLAKPGFFKRSAWEGIVLNEEVEGLLGKGALNAKDQSRQNRLLLEAAYPNYIRKS